MRNGTGMNGLLVVDKPGGMTSRDAVNHAQAWFPRGTKVGHTGTLDPLATGVLVVCVGHATRLAEFVQAMGKTYAARFRLGATSTTDDADGEVTETPGRVPPGEAAVRDALAGFVGEIEQVPPAVSALKVDGKRAHDLVRRGRDVSPAPRPVRVDAVRVVRYDWPFLDAEVDCGKGTYIRSIARDLGAKLGVGGLVQTLRRTRVGPFAAGQGIAPDATADEARSRLLPPSAVAGSMTRVRVSAFAAKRFREGVSVMPVAVEAGPDAVTAAVFDEAGGFVGVGATGPGGAVRPTVILDRWA